MTRKSNASKSATPKAIAPKVIAPKIAPAIAPAIIAPNLPNASVVAYLGSVYVHPNMFNVQIGGVTSDVSLPTVVNSSGGMPTIAIKCESNAMPSNLVYLSDGSQRYRCSICDKKFKRHWHFVRHSKNVHGVTVAALPKHAKGDPLSKARRLKPFMCATCGRWFRKRYLVMKHEATIHGNNAKRQSLKCSECMNCFSSKSNFNLHFLQDHPDIVLKNEQLVFASSEEFDQWKSLIEAETASTYVKNCTYETLKPSVIHYYGCHRSGKYRCEGKGLRHLKSMGSNKIGFYCPALIRTEIFKCEDTVVKVEVEYQSTHVGHQCELGRQRRQQAERDMAAAVRLGKNRLSPEVLALQEEFRVELTKFIAKVDQCKYVEQLQEGIEALRALDSNLEAIGLAKKRTRVAKPLNSDNDVGQDGNQARKRMGGKKHRAEEQISSFEQMTEDHIAVGHLNAGQMCSDGQLLEEQISMGHISEMHNSHLSMLPAFIKAEHFANQRALEEQIALGHITVGHDGHISLSQLTDAHLSIPTFVQM